MVVLGWWVFSYERGTPVVAGTKLGHVVCTGQVMFPGQKLFP